MASVSLGTVEGPIQLAGILALHPFKSAVLLFLDAAFEPVGSQHRNQRQGQKQGAHQRERHGFRHGMEQLSRRSAQRVNRQIPSEDDGYGVEDGAIDVLRRCQDDFVQVVALPFPQRQFAVNVFDHDHGAVDHNSEIDGADGKQVGGNVVGVQDDKREQQRQRNGERNNDGGAEADQKKDQDDQHQHHATKQVRFHGVGGESHQLAAVVVGMDFDVGRQDRAVQFLGFCFDTLQHGLGLLAAAHEDHAFDCVVDSSGNQTAEAGGVSDGDFANVSNANGHAFVAADHDVPNVFSVADQTDPADVVELAALGIESAAGVGIVGCQGGADLRDRQVISVDAGRIEQDLILHFRAAKAGVVGHAGHGAVGALDDPLFDCLQLLRGAVGTLQHVAVDQAAGAEQRGHDAASLPWGAWRRQSLKNDLPGQIVVGVVFESQADIGETIQRNRPHRIMCGTPFISSSRGSVTRRSTSSAAWPGHWVMSSTWGGARSG